MILNIKAQQSQQKKERDMIASIHPVKYVDSLDCSNIEYKNEFSDDFAPISPPFSNTGGIVKSYVKSYASDLSPSANFSCIVDFLSFSFSMNPLSLQDDIEPGDVFVNRFLSVLKDYVPHLKWSIVDKGLYGYKKSAVLSRNGQTVGVAGFEGNLNSLYISLSGQGCVGVDMSKLKIFIEVLPQCKLTRIDLAHDDLDGNTSVLDYKQAYLDGHFFTKGTKCGVKFIDDFDTGKGKTLYVGAKKNGKECCIYEKGRQLGDKTSPWVRVEGRLTANDRVVPFDAMIYPAMFLAGLYPPFSGLSAIHARLVIIKNHTKIALNLLIEHASIAYGRLIDYMILSGESEVKVIAKLRKPGTPKRLLIPETESLNMIPF